MSVQAALEAGWAEAEKERAPAVVVPLIERQEKRIEVSYDEAIAIAAWARDTIGWEEDGALRFSDRAAGDTIRADSLV